MTSDSHLFRNRGELEAEGFSLRGNTFTRGDVRYLPLYEGKMFWLLDHRFGDYSLRRSGSRDTELPRPSVESLTTPTYLPEPLFWVAETDVSTRTNAQFHLCFRDVTNANSERTVIASIVPRAAIGNKAPLIICSEPVLLAAVLSSVIVDFVARQKINAANANFFIVKQLPVLDPSMFCEQAPWCSSERGLITSGSWVKTRTLELSYTAWDLEAFAEDLGYCGPPFKWDEERRALLRAELDACFFQLYGIERDDVDYILGTFPIVNRKDVAKYGEERTRRLILERYDALAAATASGVPYETVLDPPPADPTVAHPESMRPDWAKPPARSA
jgi:hypothetical protein